MGLPVIASAVGGIPELLGDARGTVLPSVSAGTVAQALTTFVSQRREAELAARRLRAHVRAEYDVTTNARRLLDHYRSAGAPSDTATGSPS